LNTIVPIIDSRAGVQPICPACGPKRISASSFTCHRPLGVHVKLYILSCWHRYPKVSRSLSQRYEYILLLPKSREADLATILIIMSRFIPHVFRYLSSLFSYSAILQGSNIEATHCCNQPMYLQHSKQLSMVAQAALECPFLKFSDRLFLEIVE